MKKIISISILSICAAVFMTSCLKDKGFDNYEYGINLNKNPKGGITFPLAVNDVNTYGLEVKGTPQVIDDVLLVAFEAVNPAPEDVTVTLAFNPTLVTDYNTASGENLQVLAPGLYSIPSTTVVIPKGSRNAVIPLTITSTLTLDAQESYGIGIGIASVSGDYTIAQNMRNMVIKIIIKNKYDGVYRLRGNHNRPGLDLPYNEIVEMVTNGPTNVKMFWPDLGQFAHPLNGGATYYGSFTTEFFFDPTTEALIKVDNPYTPGSPPFTIGPATNSRYDPATKTMYCQYYYNANLARTFTDTLTYLGPR